jgi:hypothetical protein
MVMVPKRVQQRDRSIVSRFSSTTRNSFSKNPAKAGFLFALSRGYFMLE